MSRFSLIFNDYYSSIRQDIYAFCRALNFTPNPHQRKLLDAVMRAVYGYGSRFIAVKSGQGTGKTTVSGIILLWLTFRSFGSMGILTAPTMRQCKDIFITELRRTIELADPIIKKFIEIHQTKVSIEGHESWGIKTVTATDSKKAQGFHEKNMNIVMEEASGISRDIVEQFMGTATNPNCIILLIGNPNTRECAFFDCFYNAKNDWQTLTFNAEETPKSEYFDPARNEVIAREYGRDSDVYRIRVLGEFPHQDPNCVMSSADIEACTQKEVYNRVVRARSIDNEVIRQFGIDLARFGGDESTCWQRSGNAIVDWHRMVRKEPIEIVRHAFEQQKKWGWRNDQCQYVVDASGIGQGILWPFYEEGKNVVEFHNHGTPSNAHEYGNKGTESWFNFRTMMRNRAFYLPYDKQTIQQLSSRRYFTNKKGQIVLEPKDEYMKRGYDSPDRADGLILAGSDNEMAGGKSVLG